MCRCYVDQLARKKVCSLDLCKLTKFLAGQIDDIMQAASSRINSV